MPLLYCMVGAAGVVLMSDLWLLQAAFWPLEPSAGAPALLVNLQLFCALLCLYAIWSLALLRHWVPVSSGAGLALSACGVAYRCFIEVGRSLFGSEPLDDVAPELATLFREARHLGMIAYIAGLALVASACFSHWRLRAYADTRSHVIDHER